jgi:CDGSH-type Zn-finger protein
MTTENKQPESMRILVQKNGPYLVYGTVPLVTKTQVVTEHGEPITWQKQGELEHAETYALCRCGHSTNKPFCTGMHRKMGFDGTEAADTTTTAERRADEPGGTGVVVRRDMSLCIGSGFCGNRFSNIHKMAAETADTRVRSLIIAMAERCPSGSYTYAMAPGEPDVEPDLPKQVAVVTEVTSDGPIEGPLWVTGCVEVQRADGQPMETRNRVTLCRCGRSGIKPLCDGSHRITL